MKEGRSASAFALVPLVATLVVTFAPVLGGRVYFFEDIAAYFEPLWAGAARAMRAGRWPSYSLEAWSGQPLAGDPQLGLFYPPHWLWLWIEPARLYAASIVLHTVLAAWGSWGLLRALGRSRVAASVAAIACARSAYMVLETRHEMFVASAAWLPCLLWAIASHAERGGTRSIAAIAATLGLALLAGGWSMLVFAAPVVAIFALARARRRPHALLGSAAGLALGGALAAVQLLPALAHARLSPRALPLAAGFAGSYAWPSLRYAVTLLLPLWYGDDARGTYHGAPDQWELSGYGVGAIASVVACLALLRRRPRAEHVGYVALALIAMLIALGHDGPLWPLVHSLPLVGRTRCPARALFVITLTAPLLAAAGVDRLRALLPRRRRVLVAALPALVALELVVTFRAQNPTVPLAAAHVRPGVLASIPPAPSGDRTLIDVHLGQAFHNGGLRWGIETPGGYSSLPLWRYLHLLWIANHGRVYPGPALAHDLSAQGLWRYESPLVDLLGVRRALAPRSRPVTTWGTSAPAPGWHRQAAGADGIDLWTNDEALPRAFVVSRVRHVADAAEAARAIAEPTFSPRDEVVLESGAPPVADGDGDGDDGDARVATLDVQRPDRARLSLQLRRPGVLVVTLPHEPAWRARIDGADAEVLPADLALLGIRVPPGRHEVVLQRRDVPLRHGAILSLVALLLVALLASARPRPASARE